MCLLLPQRDGKPHRSTVHFLSSVSKIQALVNVEWKNYKFLVGLFAQGLQSPNIKLS